ncbi:MAG: flagellar protein FlaG [Candidatus Baltobacteraceae bacterium]
MDVPTVAPAAAGEQQTAPAAAIAQTGAAEAQPQSSAPAPSTDDAGTLSPVVAKIFSQGAILQPVSVDVTYRSENGAIVTVFTDPDTGKEISQVPAEVMVQIAQFFDKHSGITLDKSA